MPVLNIDDRNLSYEEYGSGPVALLIHGSPHVDAVAQVLADIGN